MKLELDPDGLRGSMDTWRQAVDMEIPLAPDLRIHFFSRRGALLDGFVKVAKNWLMLLHCCRAEGQDKADLDALHADVIAFKNWAEAGITELTRLAEEELSRDKTGL